MGPRRRLTAAMVTVVAGIVATTACSSSSTSVSSSSSGAKRPTPVVNTPSSSTSGGAGNTGAPIEGCPSVRDDAASYPNLTEATLRENAVGIYRSCNGPTGVELRIDAETDRLVSYDLDDRFVREGDGPGWVEVESCDGYVCTLKWHFPAPDEESFREEKMRLWTDPVALSLDSGSEWVRVAD